ncbi:MFS-type transporter SLC18B1-like [Oppia nitens]|uniref:MFS-type transporter SLC18B1-like n=1 Tax=Oppia nitens TaxID=1686743 RepID=UPI0023DC42BE|nr:MFS-type transporter SLC18B1-like [Oppia nitens]
MNTTKVNEKYMNENNYNKSTDMYVKQISKESVNLWSKFKLLFKTEFTRREIILISILSFGNFCFGTAFSIQGPFFPSEAHKRGVKETYIGLIIGLGEFGFVPGSIVAGSMLTRMKIKIMLIICLCLVGIANILFGLLQWCYTPIVFIICAILLRILMGLGMGIYFTACYNTIFLLFPNHISRLYATVEMCYAVGMISGPALGGVLNEIGNHFSSGFCLPFLLLGILLNSAAIITFLSIHAQKKFESTESTNILSMLSKFPIVLNVFINFNAGALIGFNTTTLDLHLETMSNLSPSLKGSIFLISGLTYALLNQVWGNMAERMDNCFKISIFGCISSLICYTLIGPVPFLPFKPVLWLIIVTQVFLGFGVGSLLVASFVQGYRETINYGFPKSQSTISILSGLFASSEAIGTACGPIIGGFIMDHFGYRWATVPKRLNPNKSINPCIVGGNQVIQHSYPWMAAIMYLSHPYPWCGGSLINDRYILTAAHCLINMNISNIKIVLGAHLFKNVSNYWERGTQMHDISDYIIHHGYNNMTDKDDLALIKLKTPVLQFDRTVWPICLPINNNTFEGQLATVVGWGHTQYLENQSEVLLEVSLNVWNNSYCMETLRDWHDILPGMVCAGGEALGGKDACQHDSGGPLLVKYDETPIWMIIGVVSWGLGCGEPNTPGVYTRVSDYTNWISSVIQNNI